MTWQQRAIGLVMLTVLTVIPVTATVCALVCQPGAVDTATHHGAGAGTHCEEATATSGRVQLRGAASHDCGGHDAVLRQASTPAETRMIVSAAPAAMFAHPLHLSVPLSRIGARVSFQSNAPPGGATPTSTPSVLRV